MLFLLACAYISDDLEKQRIDDDNDGVLWFEDCDDDNGGITKYMWYADVDGDGYGDPNQSVEDCQKPDETWVERGNDCDDSDPEIHIHALEICDGIDNNCNQLIDNDDETLSLIGQNTYLIDADQDGYPSQGSDVQNCNPPELAWSNEENEGIVIENIDTETIVYDCDDEDSAVYPNRAIYEIENFCSEDLDNDGYAPVEQGGQDCDDSNVQTHPNAEEICDEWDNNCNGENNEGLEGEATHFWDADGDGYGSPQIFLCFEMDGYVLSDEDCDDNNNQTYPSAVEICDELDNNCDGNIDEDIQQQYFVDSDGDGYGDINNPVFSCSGIPVGSAFNGGDCNDLDAESYPGATEICSDGLDNDCDNEIDDVTTFYLDEDGDSFGGVISISLCMAPDSSYVQQSGDCNDYNDEVFPVAVEIVADGIDQNCDGLEICYEDLDQDGFGSQNTIESDILDCNVPTSNIANVLTDCDDSNDAIYPAASEICDDLDNDCDSDIDEGIQTVYYLDADHDGYGNIDQTQLSCDGIPQDHVQNSDDCDDTNEYISPEKEEKCDGIDNNCIDGIDEDTAVDAHTYYLDEDGDGVGTSASLQACSPPDASFVVLTGDCDDEDIDIFPTAIELGGDGIDQNCDGLEICYEDLDGDGFGSKTIEVLTENLLCSEPNMSSKNSDCDDQNEFVSPNHVEICDEIDNDCDELIDEDFDTQSIFYFDGDGDGYGDSTDSVQGCSKNTTGYVVESGDCNDNNIQIHPNATEVEVDGVDQDCDGFELCYEDLDGDGFGIDNLIESQDVSCSSTGVSNSNADCNDGNQDINPDAIEVWYDGVDQNCDGTNDFDQDGDGFEVDVYMNNNQLIEHGGSDCEDTLPEWIACGVYPFISHTFTTCGQTGKTGPSDTHCLTDYVTSQSWHENNDYFDVNGGTQIWLVPASGVYSIYVRGASGGSNSSYSHPVSHGAEISAEVYLEQEDILMLLVGQIGTNVAQSTMHGNFNGGGGGSFVFTTNVSLVRQGKLDQATELLVAGGGGGAPTNQFPLSCGLNDGNGQLGTAGGDVICGNYTALGGVNGQGGVSFSGGNGNETAKSGGGGGGIFSPGVDGVDGCGFVRGGRDKSSQLKGGESNCDADGGFGGGGGGNEGSGGGGGGYSGGASLGIEVVEENTTLYFGGYGGGGGSYVDPSVISSTINVATITGDGEITITYISP